MISVGVHLRHRLEGARSWGRRILGKDALPLRGEGALPLRGEAALHPASPPFTRRTGQRARDPGLAPESPSAGATVGRPRPWRVRPEDVWLALLVALVSLVSFMERATLTFDTSDGLTPYANPSLVGAAQVLVG